MRGQFSKGAKYRKQTVTVTSMQTETSSDKEYNRTTEGILSFCNKNLEIRPYKEVTAQKVNMAAIAPQSLSKTCIRLPFSRALNFVDNNAF